LRQAAGYYFNGYYGISNYIDQDETLLDYNCVDRTYDTNSGYNHLGTDLFL